MRFNYGSGVAAGVAQSLTNAGYIDTAGFLQCQKPMTVKGQYMGGTKYNQRSFGTPYNNSTTEASWSTGVTSATGSLTYGMATTSLGVRVRFTGYAMMSMVSGSVTFRFRTSAYSSVIADLSFTPSAFTNQLVKLTVDMVWISGQNANTILTASVPGLTSCSKYSSFGLWYSQNTNGLDVTAQFSAASTGNTFQSYDGILETLNDG